MGETIRAERSRNAAALLSTTGALLLGVGLGALAGARLGSTAWLVAGIGLVAHLSGMVSARRLQQDAGHRFARWESWGYWACWVLIVLGVIAALWRSLAGEGF